MNKYIGECFRSGSSSHTSKNFTSDNECSPTTPVNNFLQHTNPQGWPRVLSHSSNANVFTTSACLLPSQHIHNTPTHTTHTTHNTEHTHSETDTDNPQRQPKHKPTDGRMEGDRVSQKPTHTPCTDTPHTQHAHTKHKHRHTLCTRRTLANTTTTHNHTKPPPHRHTDTQTHRHTGTTFVSTP